MKINDITKPVEEGINDPHIFKAVFMAGPLDQVSLLLLKKC